jgi:hypothetical protein
MNYCEKTPELESATDTTIQPIRLKDNLFPYMLQSNADYEKPKHPKYDISFGDIKNWFLSFFFKIPPPEPPERVDFDDDEYRRELIRQISTRDREAVIKLWEDCGIDRTTAEYYMDCFALKDNEGKKFDLIIPSDPATAFLWYRYEVYCWEEIGNDFGIYIYVFVYGFFFPHLIFEASAFNEISNEDLRFLEDNFEQFERKMTMGRTVELILLYKNERNMHSRFFESDLPFGSVYCNQEWREKLLEYRNK